MKRLLSVLFNLFLLLAWHQIIIVIIRDFLLSVNAAYIERVILYSVYYFSAVISSFLITIFNYFKKRWIKFYLWYIIAIVNLALHALFKLSPERAIIFAFLGGLAFGVGFPFCFSLFAENSLIEKRGRLSGSVLFMVGFFLTLFAILSTYLKFESLMIISTLQLTVGILILSLLNFSKINNKQEHSYSYTLICTDRNFLLYLLSWITFCFIDAVEVPILRNYLRQNFGVPFEDFLVTIYTLIAAFSFLLSGFLADFYGRKKLLIYGFIILGLAYAVIGIAAYSFISWLTYFIFYGLASGLLLTIYTLIIWGDLSRHGLIDKYYVIGQLPYFTTRPLGEFITPYITLIPISAAFSLASFFLFLSIFPLMYASETLPEKAIRKRELKSYIEKAKKIREKFTKS